MTLATNYVATLAQILSPVWALSLNGNGGIAEGLAAIRQSISIILRTTKGTDPLRPEFGSDVWKYADAPVDIAIPNIKKSILEALALWEPRIKVLKVEHELEMAHLSFNIVYQLTDSAIVDILSYNTDGNIFNDPTNVTSLVLQGFFPPNPGGFQYKLYAELDNNDLLPAPPADGFADTYDMYLWVKTNWSNYGKWYYTATSIIGHIKPQYRQGKIEISIITKKRFQGGIPVLPIAYHYTVTINVDGTDYDNTGSLLYTADQIRSWCQSHLALGALGIWQIVNNPGSFDSGEFSEDFELYLQLLVINTANANSVVITIETAI
jgi:phage baseplate assembly protein W